MVDTSVQAELQNCIRQAQDKLTRMGPMISQLGDKQGASQLEEMNAEAGRLLREAQERCEKLL